MENESTAEKLLNEGLELLSSEKPQKQKKGFYSLRGATALGHMKAFYYEGVCYKEGLGIYQSDERAFERFLVAADEVPEAKYELGLCYIHGMGTEQDIDKAVACFSDAAQRGVPEAQYELGVCYRRGEGVEQDIKTALYWYEKAASQGYLRAYHNIGIVYQHGLGGIPTDYNKAFNYFLKAANEESTEPYFCIGK